MSSELLDFSSAFEIERARDSQLCRTDMHRLYYYDRIVDVKENFGCQVNIPHTLVPSLTVSMKLSLIAPIHLPILLVRSSSTHSHCRHLIFLRQHKLE